MQKLYLVKLGGSVITDIRRPNVARTAVIGRLMQEVKSAQGKNRVILGHGAGSFGHVVAAKFRVTEGMKAPSSRKGAALTQFSASRLHAIVMNGALRAGMPALSFSPSTGVIARNGRIISWDITPIRKALECGFLPIGYGDVVLDSAQGFSVASTEEIIRHLAGKLKTHMIIVGTDVDGVFTSDPKSDPDAELVRKVGRRNIGEVLKMVGGSKKVDVTGGMKGKLIHLYNISKSTGAVCQIVNASRKGDIRAALSGKRLGTLIDAN